ncbi:hypothetical protein OHT57_03380 [Streptomyces sp. NBC_00285]|nr:hypothetical protein [Streptomyces sp. NBC_00285]
MTGSTETGGATGTPDRDCNLIQAQADSRKGAGIGKGLLRARLTGG